MITPFFASAKFYAILVPLGKLHEMEPGDFIAFPSGTEICHAFINEGEESAVLLVGGEARKADNQIYYPLHPHNGMPRTRESD